MIVFPFFKVPFIRLGLAALGWTALLILASGCKAQLSAEDLVKQADLALQKNDHASAAIHLRAAVQQKPNEPAIRMKLGREYARLAQFHAAEQEFRRALELQPGLLEAKHAILKMLLAQQAFDRVLDETKIVTSKVSAAPANLIAARGLALLGTGQTLQAEQLFQRALALDERSSFAKMGQARLSFAKGEFKQALSLTEEVLKAEPDDLDALQIKAEFLSLTGQTQDAILAYRAVLAAYPNTIPAHVRLASMLSELGKESEAQAAITQLRQIAPNNALADYVQAILFARQNRFAQARDALAIVHREMPKFVPAWVLEGMIELAGNRPKEAANAFTAALRQAPDHLVARTHLARAQMRAGQALEAYETLRPLLDKVPPIPEALRLAGEALLHANEPKAAMALFQRATQLSPEDGRLQKGLAVAKWAEGDIAGALPILDGAPRDADAQAMAAAIRIIQSLESGKIEQARREATALRAQQPKDALINNIYGAVFARSARYVEARQGFEAALAVQPAYYPALVNVALLDLREGKKDSAFARFDALLKQDPSHLSALLGKATIGMRADLPPEQILEILTRARAAHPQALRPVLLSAQVWAQTGHTTKALEAAKEAHRLAPRDPEVLQTLGNLQLTVGEAVGAATTFSQWAALQPRAFAPLLGLAQAQKMGGRPAAGLQSVQRALDLAPRTVAANLVAIELLVQTGRVGDAQKQLEKLRRLAPSEAQLAEAEADVRSAVAIDERVVDFYKRALQLSPSTRLLGKLQHALVDLKRGDEALSMGQEWMKRYPEDIAAHLISADLAFKLQRHRIAAENYERVATLQPENLLVWNNLAAAYTEFDPKRAVEAGLRAQQLAPENPSVLDTLGWAYLKNEQASAGVRILEKAVRLAPENVEIGVHYVSALVAAGDSASAKLYLIQMLEKNPRLFKEAPIAALAKQLEVSEP